MDEEVCVRVCERLEGLLGWLWRGLLLWLKRLIVMRDWCVIDSYKVKWVR